MVAGLLKVLEDHSVTLTLPPHTTDDIEKVRKRLMYPMQKEKVFEYQCNIISMIICCAYQCLSKCKFFCR